MAKKAVVKNPQERADYIGHGTDDDASFKGLRLANDDDVIRIKDKKGRFWTLSDMTMFGPTATESYLREVCRQHVAELDAGTPIIQSEDPRKPNYAPPLLWPPEP